MRRNFLSFILIEIVMGLIFWIQTGRSASLSAHEHDPCDSFGIQRFQEQKEAPVFTLQTLEGKPICLKDLKGMPVLITFWATWCSSCKEDLLLLERFSAGKRDQIAFLLIAIDGERKKVVQRIIERHQITLPVLLLLKEKVMDQYGVRGWVPQTFLIDREGVLVGKMVGPRDWSSPEAWPCLKNLLGLH